MVKRRCHTSWTPEIQMVNLTLRTFENQLWGLERSARNTQPCPLPSPFCSSFWPDTHFPIFELFLKIRVPQGYNVPLGCEAEVQWSSLHSCNFSSVHAWDLLPVAPRKWEDTHAPYSGFARYWGAWSTWPAHFEVQLNLSMTITFIWRRNGNAFQYSCLENSHGQRSLAGYSPWGHKESDMA